MLQAVLLGAGLLAQATGEREEETVESVVPESALERHQRYAEQFLWATGLILALAGTVLLVRKPGPAQALAAIAVFGTILVAAAAVRVGHAGGQLVCAHNAAAAYTAGRDAKSNATATGPSHALAADSSGSKENGDD